MLWLGLRNSLRHPLQVICGEVHSINDRPELRYKGGFEVSYRIPIYPSEEWMRFDFSCSITSNALIGGRHHSELACKKFDYLRMRSSASTERWMSSGKQRVCLQCLIFTYVSLLSSP